MDQENLNLMSRSFAAGVLYAILKDPEMRATLRTFLDANDNIRRVTITETELKLLA
jgi:hypothetical protein